MSKQIEAWSTEWEEGVVVGTHDRVEALIHMARHYEGCFEPQKFSNVNFAGIPSRKVWARPDWETCDENDPLVVPKGTPGAVPMMIFNGEPEVDW